MSDGLRHKYNVERVDGRDKPETVPVLAEHTVERCRESDRNWHLMCDLVVGHGGSHKASVQWGGSA